MTPKERKKYYLEYKKQLSKSEQYAYGQFKPLLTSQVERLVDTLTKKGLEITIAMISELIPYAEVENAVVGVYVAIGKDFSKWLSSRLPKQKKDPSFSVGFFSQTFIDLMTKYAKEDSSEHIKGITDTTRDLARKSLMESANQNLDIRKTAIKLKKDVGGVFSRKRAMRIARTETTAAANYSQFITAQNFGIALQKEWIATRDKRTRDAHVAVDGKVIDMDANFPVGGASMKYPGDPKGGVRNVVNCRCTVAYIPKEEEYTITQVASNSLLLPIMQELLREEL